MSPPSLACLLLKFFKIFMVFNVLCSSFYGMQFLRFIRTNHAAELPPDGR